MNWFKRSSYELDRTAEFLLLFQNIFEDLAPQYGFLLTNIFSPNLNNLRLHIEDPENRFRYVVSFRIDKNKVNMTIAKSGAELEDLQNQTTTRTYTTSDVYAIANEVFEIINGHVRNNYKQEDRV